MVSGSQSAGTDHDSQQRPDQANPLLRPIPVGSHAAALGSHAWRQRRLTPSRIRAKKKGYIFLKFEFLKI